MAVFDTARLKNVLVRGKIAEDAPAQELVDEIENQASRALSEYATLDRMELMEARMLRAIAEAEARQARHINQAVGILLAGLALAVGILLGFG